MKKSTQSRRASVQQFENRPRFSRLQFNFVHSPSRLEAEAGFGPSDPTVPGSGGLGRVREC